MNTQSWNKLIQPKAKLITYYYSSPLLYKFQNTYWKDRFTSFVVRVAHNYVVGFRLPAK